MSKFRGTVLVVLVFAVVSGAWAKRDDPFIFLNEEELLQVSFYYNANVDLNFSAPSIADAMEQTAREEFAEALAVVLERTGFPMAVEIVDPLDRVEKGLPVLEIYAVRWERDRMNTLEAVIRARLKADGYRNKLGSFRSRGSLTTLSSQEFERRARIEAMTKALTEMMYELNRHFKLPGE